MQEKIDKLEIDLATVKGELGLLAHTLKSIDKTLQKFEQHLTDFQDARTTIEVMKIKVDTDHQDIVSIKRKLDKLQVDEASTQVSLTTNEKIIWAVLTGIVGTFFYVFNSGVLK